MGVKNADESHRLLVGVTETLLAEIEERKAGINQSLSTAETAESSLVAFVVALSCLLIQSLCVKESQVK